MTVLAPKRGVDLVLQTDQGLEEKGRRGEVTF
jgi:hypothetical protein